MDGLWRPNAAQSRLETVIDLLLRSDRKPPLRRGYKKEYMRDLIYKLHIAHCIYTSFCCMICYDPLHIYKFQADQNRISRNQVPVYCVQGRFERINQHPNAGSHAFSIGITEVLNTNLMVELSADDIEYVFQRSDGRILGITVPTFEALTQFGTATITTKNIGEVEASYSFTFDCSSGVNQMEEQFYIMKPAEEVSRSFKLYPTSDQAARYACAAILKDADFNEVDRAECEFTTTTTVLENGSQVRLLSNTIIFEAIQK